MSPDEVSALADKVYGRKTTAKEQTGIVFIATFSKSLTVIDENDKLMKSNSLKKIIEDFQFNSVIPNEITEFNIMYKK